MNDSILISLMLFTLSNGALADLSEVPVQPEGLQPKMRPIDRDWSYFKTIPCERIKKEVFHSRSEELLLAQRKSQCINKYKAFLSQPVNQ